LNKFYQVTGLQPGVDIIETPDGLLVDLSAAMSRAFLYNDKDLLSSQRRGEYIWASGGGTLLLNDRYVLIVQRSFNSRVNPGKFSLFTGRADSLDELLRPVLLIRELFEELVLFTKYRLCMPTCNKFAATIQKVYGKMHLDLGFDLRKPQTLCLQWFQVSPKTITVRHQAGQSEELLDFYINSRGEVNILFVLAADLNVNDLQAMDGEYCICDGILMRENRRIFLYDLETSMAKDISFDSTATQPQLVPTSLMTDHLRYLIRSLNSNLDGGPAGISLSS